LQGSPLLLLPIYGLWIFLIAFVSMVLRTLTGKANRYDHVRNLPLDDDYRPERKEDDCG